MLLAMTDHALIDRLDTYYDAVPRLRADTEEIGPFTLFVARSGWPYYARPARRQTTPVTVADVELVLARQRELAVPQSIEWVGEAAPDLAATVEAAGVRVEQCPLLVLDGAPRGNAAHARILSSDERDVLVASRAAVSAAFSAGGTAVGDEGTESRDASLDSPFAAITESVVARIDAGELTTAAAFAPDAGPVGGGSYSPVAGVAEIAGVGVLPAYRRRGLAAQVTYLLAADALARGATTVFCSAQSDDVARVYEGVGFVRVGTACIASADGDHAG